MKKTNKVSLWPSWFLDSIDKETKNNIKKNTLKKLAKGQLYLWDALNIYDDILDGTSGSEKLTDANGNFRCYLEIYYRLGLPNEFYKLFNYLLKNLEDSNKKESEQKKLKIANGLVTNSLRIKLPTDLKYLSNKSLPLCSGALAIIYLAGDKRSINKVPDLINFFEYALAAKQLSDDAKDWLEDFQSKSITYPIQLILNKARQKKININLTEEPTAIYLLFSEIAPLISKEITLLCLKAKKAGKKLGLSKNSPLILNIIVPLEKSVEKAMKFHALL